MKIEFVRDEPSIFWQVQPHEYGFISNVNPNIPHPRWPQNVSFWLDTEDTFATPIYNGYDEYVADLYPDEPREMQRPLGAGTDGTLASRYQPTDGRKGAAEGTASIDAVVPRPHTVRLGGRGAGRRGPR